MPSKPVSATSLSYRIADVQALSGLGRTTLYAMIRAGVLPARKCGACTVVLHTDLVEFLERLPTIKNPASGQ